MILIYVTCKDETEARKIAKELLDKRLVACGNMIPIKSMYNWEGKFCDDSEVVLLLKTKDDMYEKVKGEIKKLHSYDVPCILRINVEANKEFDDWVKGEVTSP